MCVDRAGCFGADLARPLSNIPLHPTTLSYRPPLPPNARTPGHPAEKEEHHKCALAGPYPSVAAPQIYLGWRYPPSQPAHLSPPIGFLVNGPVWALHEDCRSRVFFADLWSANPMVCFPVSPLLKVAQAKHLGFSTYLVQTANPILGSPSLDR